MRWRFNNLRLHAGSPEMGSGPFPGGRDVARKKMESFDNEEAH
jgi:hypothetical protein